MNYLESQITKSSIGIEEKVLHQIFPPKDAEKFKNLKKPLNNVSYIDFS
jgi:hypothetical protein